MITFIEKFLTLVSLVYKLFIDVIKNKIFKCIKIFNSLKKKTKQNKKRDIGTRYTPTTKI